MMIKIVSKYIRLVVLIIVTGLSITSCVNYDFENPAPIDIPTGEVLTIAQLRQLHVDEGRKAHKFTSDVSIYGTVTMDGSSGNIYRSAYLEDATGAINLRLMSPGGLYQGDSIRINLNKTVLSEYQQMLQIDSVHVGNNIVKLATMKIVEPTLVSIADLLTGNYQARLIRLDNVQFIDADLGKTFADKVNLVTENRTIEGCGFNENQIIIRTSGYAKFADQPVPTGKGSIIAVAAQFRDEMQLYIRDSKELEMKDGRCERNIISIAEIRDLFANGAAEIPPAVNIEAVVISDRANGNLTARNAVIQDDSGRGIALRFMSNHTFNLGDKIRISAGTLEISEFNELLQVNNIPNGNAAVIGTGIKIQPVQTTIQNLLSNMDEFESTLVQITNATITGGNTFAGTRSLSDGTANIDLFTRNEASFANTAIPAGTLTLTGIVSVFNTPQIIIRSTEDIQQ